MIPRMMHQAYIGGEPAGALLANVKEHKARNSNWQHILWNDCLADKFIAAQYGEEMLRTYYQIDSAYPAARVDLLCNLIIQHYGGVYFDIKSVFERPLDDVLRPTDRYLLAQWRNGPGEPNEGWGLHRDLAHIPGGEYMKHFIIAEPGHTYSKAVIRKITQNIRSYRPWNAVGRTGTLRTTGPIAYTLGIESVKDECLHRVVTEREIGVKYSLGGDYNHQESLPRTHYSLLNKPIVTQSPMGNFLSKAIVRLRELDTQLPRRTARSR